MEHYVLPVSFIWTGAAFSYFQERLDMLAPQFLKTDCHWLFKLGQ